MRRQSVPLPASASVSLAWVAHPRYFKLWPNPKLSTGRRRCARCWLAERHCVCGALPALAPLRRVRRIFTVVPPQELGHPNPNPNPTRTRTRTLTLALTLTLRLTLTRTRTRT